MPRTLSLDGPDWTLYWLQPGEWQTLRVWEQEPPEVAERRVPAQVPGTVQGALQQTGTLPDLYAPLSQGKWLWTGERDWVYEKRFTVPAEWAAGEVALEVEGLEWHASPFMDPVPTRQELRHALQFFLNGKRLGPVGGTRMGAFSCAELVLPGAENHLLVVVERQQVPELETAGLAVLGLPAQLTLRSQGTDWFRSVAIHTNLALDRTEAVLSLVCELDGGLDLPALVLTEITQAGLPVTSAEDAVRIFGSETFLVQSLVLPRVQLWWPNGHGRQPLYEARISLGTRDGKLLDQRRVTFGVRQVEAVAEDGAPEGAPPSGLRINGKPVWLNGWTWQLPDPLFLNEPERYEYLLRLAQEAGVNLLRVHSRNAPESERFYRLCDQLGLMVWQELPAVLTLFPTEFASAREATHAAVESLFADLGRRDPQVTDEMVAGRQQLVQATAEGFIAARRNHPSLIGWSGARCEPDSAQAAALVEALGEVVAEEDSQRLWMPAAHPLSQGPGGALAFAGLRGVPRQCDEDRTVLSDIECSATTVALRLTPVTALVPGVLPGSAPSDEIQEGPLRGGSAGAPSDAAFGIPAQVTAWSRASLAFQALTLQYWVEACRRRQWQSGGAVVHDFNAAWPTPWGNHAVEWSGDPRPAYYAVQRAFRPFHVSAAFPSFAWEGEAHFRAEVWLHNTGDAKGLLNAVATVYSLSGRELFQENLACEASENGSESAGDLSWRFPDGFAEPFVLCLEVIDEEGETLARNAYWHSRAQDPAFAAFLDAPVTALQVARTPNGIAVRNPGPALALGVTVEAGAVLVADSDFPLAPGEAREIPLSDPKAPARVSAWNASPREIPSPTATS